MEGRKHYKCQHVANDIHVVFESPGRCGTTNRVTPAVSVVRC
jgi:hypothetical protein